MKKTVKGYKVANPDGTCRGFKFEVGQTYKYDGEIIICLSGFHFCLKAQDCFSYYSFDSANVVFEVEAIGKIITHEEDSRCVTDDIHIIRQLTWSEVLEIANSGKDNTGHSNSGDRNSGYSNSGDRNSGDRNSGNYNSGNYNSGYRNSGDRNSGDRNSGNYNSGDRNSGYSNSGDRNSGDRNSGNYNSGNYNSGDRNSGDRNSGDRNSGNYNSGNYNSGNYNSGYSNSGDYNSGAFCTNEPKMRLFNQESSLSFGDFENSYVFRLLCEVDTKIWVQSEIMTEEEKTKYPSHSTCGGYLKDIPYKEAFQNKWGNWSKENRQAFLDLPNFDSEIFFEITGVKID